MRNDGYPPGGFDPLTTEAVLGASGWWAMPPSFTSPSQALDRLAMLEEAKILGAQASAIAPPAPRRRRLSQMLSRVRKIALWGRRARAQ